jgi:hypothetical protein
MSGIFDPPEPPREGPTVAAERQRQERFASNERIRSIQENLRFETEADLAGVFGVRSLSGGLSPTFGNSFNAAPQRARRSLLGVG